MARWPGTLVGLALALMAGTPLLAGAGFPPDPDAFSRHMAGIDSAIVAKFNYGRGLFHFKRSAIRHADGTMTGLGPLYNAVACGACHGRDGRGVPEGEEASLVLALAGPNGPDPIYGNQLQDKAVGGMAPEGRITISYEEIPFRLGDGEIITLRKPIYALTDLAYGPLDPMTDIGPRIAPPLIGMGLLEGVEADALTALADPDDKNGDGILGVINRVDGKIGRFGWKAAVGSVAAQIEKASRIDMGLSVPSSSDSDCLIAACRSESADPLEISANDLRLLTIYSVRLEVPAPRGLDTPLAQQGKAVFAKLGCAACHQPSLPLSKAASAEYGVAEIAPYSDLLIHDIGPGLADGISAGLAGPRDWRTAPLWGIGRTAEVTGAEFYLHDGRARSLTEAILWHDGEAKAARDSFAGLSSDERMAMLAFLAAL